MTVYTKNNDLLQDSQNLTKFRIVLLGDPNVGKTSIITQFINNSFRESYFPTSEIKYFYFIYSIYKKLYNFYTKKEQIDEFAFIEILDT